MQKDDKKPNILGQLGILNVNYHVLFIVLYIIYLCTKLTPAELQIVKVVSTFAKTGCFYMVQYKGD